MVSFQGESVHGCIRFSGRKMRDTVHRPFTRGDTLKFPQFVVKPACLQGRGKIFEVPGTRTGGPMLPFSYRQIYRVSRYPGFFPAGMILL